MSQLEIVTVEWSGELKTGNLATLHVIAALCAVSPDRRSLQGEKKATLIPS